jgi:hypothetical protein
MRIEQQLSTKPIEAEEIAWAGMVTLWSTTSNCREVARSSDEVTTKYEGETRKVSYLCKGKITKNKP